MRFRLNQTEVFIGYEAVAAMTAALLLDQEGRVVCCFLSALLHECGHLLTMCCFRCKIRSVMLGLFDININADAPKSAGEDFLITSAGVMTNFLFAAVCYPISRMMSLSHLVIGGFNLLPLESLDGGRLLTILLSRHMSELAAVRVVKILTFVFLTPILCGGIFVLLRTKYNYSLLAVSLYLLAVLFLK